jgi:outer membrane protein assembly factor BamA
MLRHVAVSLLVFLAAGQAQTLTGVGVTGNQRLPVAAIVKSAPLRIGQRITKDELEKANQALFDTGFFTSVKFRYKTQPTAKGMAWSVTFEVVEDRADTTALLDIPGLDEQKLWQDLKAADGLLDLHLPSNDQVAEYYRRAIEAFLTKAGHPHKIEISNEADLVTRKSLVVFMPSDLPEVTEVRFEGNQQVDTARLQAATSMLLVGGKHSERELGKIIDFNLRPIYEELGYLTVTFPSVKLDGPTAAVKVVEGPQWTLGKVTLNGDQLPEGPMLHAGEFAEGKTANWKVFTEDITKMEKVLRHDGYLAPFSKPVRQFHQAGQIVDVRIDVRKGTQSFFNAVEFHGLTPDQEEKIRPLWKLKAEAPMDQPYIDEFWLEAYRLLSGAVKSINSQVRPHPDSNLVDVVLVFKQ